MRSVCEPWGGERMLELHGQVVREGGVSPGRQAGRGAVAGAGLALGFGAGSLSARPGGVRLAAEGAGGAVRSLSPGMMSREMVRSGSGSSAGGNRSRARLVMSRKKKQMIEAGIEA